MRLIVFLALRRAFAPLFTVAFVGLAAVGLMAGPQLPQRLAPVEVRAERAVNWTVEQFRHVVGGLADTATIETAPLEPSGLMSAPAVDRSGPGWVDAWADSDVMGVSWDACHPILWTTNIVDPSLFAVVEQSFERLAAATPHTFEYAGFNDFVPVDDTWTTTVEATGAGQPIIHIVAAPGAQLPLLGEAAGLGSVSALDLTATTGLVQLDSDRLDVYDPGFGAGRTDGALILHELGHVFGLGHVADNSSLMFEQMIDRQTGEFARSDLDGLATLNPPCGH